LQLKFKQIYYNTVTCQPIVELRNRALLGSRPLNASRPNIRYATTGEAVSSPCRAEPNRTVRCYTRGRDDVTRQHARFQGNAVVDTVTTQQIRCQPLSFLGTMCSAEDQELSERRAVVPQHGLELGFDDSEPVRCQSPWSAVGVSSSPGILSGSPYTSSATDACRSSLNAVRIPRITRGRASVQCWSAWHMMAALVSGGNVPRVRGWRCAGRRTSLARWQHSAPR
jgi:hypothetical protein